MQLDAHLASCQECRTLVFALSSDAVAQQESISKTDDGPTDAIGRFAIRDELGRGAMGIVYLGYDPELKREVAIKVLASNSVLATSETERLQREGQALARLSHANVVSVHEAGVEEGQRYVVMERLDVATHRGSYVVSQRTSEVASKRSRAGCRTSTGSRELSWLPHHALY